MNTYVANPLMVQHDQNTAASTWTIPVIEGVPFQGWARSVRSVINKSVRHTSDGTRMDVAPLVNLQVGLTRWQVSLSYSTARRGSVCLYLRMGRPK